MKYGKSYRFLFLSLLLAFVLPGVASASYNDAVNQGEILRQKLINFEKAIISGDVVKINRFYDDFTNQLRLTEARIGKVYGLKNRRGLIEKYVTPAKIAYERTKYEISQYRLLNRIQGMVDARKKAESKEHLAMLDRLKRRAKEIKQLGGYEPLPNRINQMLLSQEERVRKNVDNLESGVTVKTGVVTANVLNVRAGRTTDSAIVGKLTEGSQVEVFDIVGSWASIRFQSLTGYVHTDYLRIDEKDERPVSKVGIVTADVLNVRAERTTISAVIGQLREGERVEVLDIEGDWGTILLNGSHAYVHMNYIRLESGQGSETPDPEMSLSGKTITIDPGHGGHDPGATAFGMNEKSIVLDVGLLVRNKLEQAGAIVVLTRSNDTFIELSERSRIANNASANIFVSIHVNAADSEAVHGTETYWNDRYESNESKELAEKIQKRLIEKLKSRDRGVKEANFAVIRNSTMPSVLVELGFITNASEAEKLKSAAYQEKAADAIYLGILDYYSDN